MTPVRRAPEPGLLELRRRWLEARGHGNGGGAAQEGEKNLWVQRRLRVVCYNILADMCDVLGRGVGACWNYGQQSIDKKQTGSVECDGW